MLYTKYKDADKQTKKEWDSLLFNSIEQFAFLVNNKFIKNDKMTHFFDDAVVKWYDDIFVKYHTSKEIDDKDVFPEFKKLYRIIKTKREVGAMCCKIPVKQLKIVVSTMAGALLGVLIDRIVASSCQPSGCNYYLWLIPIGVLAILAIWLSKIKE